MSEKQSIDKVYSVQRFTKKDGSRSVFAEEIKGEQSYLNYLIKMGLCSEKKPQVKKES